MIQKTIKLGDNEHRQFNCYISQFDGTTELANYVKEATPNKIFNGRRQSSLVNGKEEGFHDFYSFPSAVEALEYGTDMYLAEFTKKYKTSKEYIENQLSRKPQGFRKDVVGFLPIVPNVLVGNPINMINSDVKPHKIPTAKIFIDRSATCGFSCEEIVGFESIVFALIQIMENQGIRCEIYATDTSFERCGYEEARALILKIKEYMQPLNLYKIQFPIVAPDFFRRISFRLLETDDRIENYEWIDGYGTSVKNCSMEDFHISAGKIGEGYKKMFDLKDTDVYVPGIDYFGRGVDINDRIKQIIGYTNFSKYFNLKELSL